MAIVPSMGVYVFEAIGTRWQIDILEERAPKAHALLFGALRARIEEFDRAYSRFRDDSLVTHMSRQEGIYTLPRDATPMMDCYAALYRLTQGAFTPLIGSVLEEAGYDAAYSLRPTTLHPPLPWDEAMAYHDPQLIMKRPALLDFGAAGKGHLVDLVGDLMEEHGIRAYTIDAGGDILHHNATGPPLRVGLEHPERPQQVIGVYLLNEGSICCSAGNRRAWGAFHHIIDPRTLSSPRDVASVWVVAAHALIADALATALFLAPASGFAPHFEFEYLLMRPDASVEYSAGFHAEIFEA